MTRWIGIVVLAGAFIVCMQGDRASESPFEKARYCLRIGMTPEEAYAVANLRLLAGSSGSMRHFYCFFWDAQRDEILNLQFATKGNLFAGTMRDRLETWSVTKTASAD